MPTSKRRQAQAKLRPGQPTIREELAAFYASIRARALLIAIEWAGSASNLGELVGYKRHTGMTWARRGRISVEGAHRLARLEDFPLTVDEMCPGQRVDPIQCKHCSRLFAPHGERSGSLPSFNGKSKAVRQARRKQAEHRANASR